MSMKTQLHDVHDRIMAVKWPDKSLSNLLQHELLPIIEENGILKNEYDRRILYYERLTKDASYLELIQNIHKEIMALQKLIDPLKLPVEPRLFKPRHDDPEKNEPWIVMKDLHAILGKEETWWRLGSVTVHQVDDHVRTPWRPVVRQYEIFMALVNHAYAAGALKEKKANDHVAALQKYLGDLERRLERPFVRLHIHDFDYLDHYTRNGKWIGDDEKSVERVKQYADRVCKDLFLFLEEQKEKSTKLVEINSWMKDEERKRAELQQEYERLSKKLDISDIVKRYKNNPALTQAIQNVTSPAFLERVGKTMQFQEELKEVFGKQLADINKMLDAPELKKVQRAMEDVNKQLERIKPDLEEIEQQRAAVAAAFSTVDAQMQSALPSMVEFGKMMSEQNELIQNAGRSLITGSDGGVASFLSISPSVPTLPPDAVIITREEYLEYERLKAKYSTEQAKGDEKQNVIAWRGDLEIEYSSMDRHLRVGEETVIVPETETADKRQILLRLLVDIYQEENGTVKSVSSEMFWEALRGKAIKCSERDLKTAVQDLRKEIKSSLGYSGFIRTKGNAAYIPRDDKM